MKTEELREKDLMTMSKEDMAKMIINLNRQVDALNQNVDLLIDQIKVMNQRRYGQKSEINKSDKYEQLQLEGIWFDEAEYSRDETVKELTLEKAAPKKKTKGKKRSELSKITNHRDEYIELSKEELDSQFGKDNWKRISYEIVRKLEHHPASFEAVSYHIGVYACKDEKRNPSEATVIRAAREAEILPGTIVTPSLLSSIVFAKYVNHVPLYRQEKAFENQDIFISRKNMANWIINSYERYLKYMEPGFKAELMSNGVIHADETPFKISKDGREKTSQSYMWVYRSRKENDRTPVIVYEYQLDRKAEHPKEFLREFSGYVVCDGYSGYKKVENETDNILISGCWVHAKRKFSEYVKAKTGKNNITSIAKQGEDQISYIYHLEHQSEGMDREAHYKYRQEVIKPYVDRFFQWAKENKGKTAPQAPVGKALNYVINQEEYLRRFLDDPELPLDNNAAERAIRPFTIGRKNFVMIDTVRGAAASAFLYSLIETAKANNLKLYDYLNYLFTELPKYINGFKTVIPEQLYPWSEDLPKILRKDAVSS